MKSKRAVQTRTLSLPVAAPFKTLVKELAARDGRKPTQFARRVLERGVNEEAKAAGLSPVPASVS